MDEKETPRMRHAAEPITGRRRYLNCEQTRLRRIAAEASTLPLPGACVAARAAAAAERCERHVGTRS